MKILKTREQKLPKSGKKNYKNSGTKLKKSRTEIKKI
jgi:hypothetical protein